MGIEGAGLLELPMARGQKAGVAYTILDDLPAEPSYLEASALYKYDNQYYLALEATKEGMLDVSAVLGGDGQWSYVPAPFFVEHGQVLIAENAVSNLAR